MAVAFGATKAADGKIQPPSFESNPMYWLVVVGLLIVFLGALILSGGM